MCDEIDEKTFMASLSRYPQVRDRDYCEIKKVCTSCLSTGLFLFLEPRKIRVLTKHTVYTTLAWVDFYLQRPRDVVVNAGPAPRVVKATSTVLEPYSAGDAFFPAAVSSGKQLIDHKYKYLWTGPHDNCVTKTRWRTINRMSDYRTPGLGRIGAGILKFAILQVTTFLPI